MFPRSRLCCGAVTIFIFAALLVWHLNDLKLNISFQHEVIEAEVNEIVQDPEPKVTPDPKKFEINKEHGFWSGKTYTRYHRFDKSLAAALTAFFTKEGAKCVIDLGGGMGLYTKTFLANNIFSSCYDGNPNTQDISEGRCAVADLSKTIKFVAYDWVMSLEVGEHIPKQYEDVFIHNIDRVNKLGAVVSWGIVGQGGTGHVNNRNNDYIRAKFQAMGYTSDPEVEKILRASAKASWFRRSIMVFRRQMNTTAETS